MENNEVLDNIISYIFTRTTLFNSKVKIYYDSFDLQNVFLLIQSHVNLLNDIFLPLLENYYSYKAHSVQLLISTILDLLVPVLFPLFPSTLYQFNLLNSYPYFNELYINLSTNLQKNNINLINTNSNNNLFSQSSKQDKLFWQNALSIRDMVWC
jgi:hypothetical protein